MLERDRTQAALRRLLRLRALKAEGADVIRQRAAKADDAHAMRQRVADWTASAAAASARQPPASGAEAAATSSGAEPAPLTTALTTASAQPRPATAGSLRRVHLVVNPFGGGGIGQSVLESVLPIFERAGIDVTVLETQYAGHAGDLARTQPLLDAFVGIGGDGTAHEIANGLLQREAAERVPMGMIPAGSGNTWCYDLGLESAADAAEAIVCGATSSVDVMKVQATAAVDVSASGPTATVDEYAINICGFGMPAAVLAQANALRWLGSAQYELAGLVLIAMASNHGER